jgi:hypothetical protein
MQQQRGLRAFSRSGCEALLRAAKRTLWLGAALVALTGCENSYACCLKRDEQARAACMLECARAANPMSDEEGEDLVYQCYRSGTDIACSKWGVVSATNTHNAIEAACIRAGGVP